MARVPWVTALSVPLRTRISETSLERGNFAKGRTQAGYPSSPNLSISPWSSPTFQASPLFLLDSVVFSGCRILAC